MEMITIEYKYEIMFILSESDWDKILLEIIKGKLL